MSTCRMQDIIFENIYFGKSNSESMFISLVWSFLKLEIARCKKGYLNFESFIREFNQNKALKRN